MPRSNRPRGRRREPVEEPDDLSRLLAGWKRTERRRTGLWNVQPVGGGRGEKAYTCPGCGRDIAPGTPHLVAWRADGPLGDTSDLEARRHWHTHCWKVS
jgi:hypothetical protein